MPANVRALAIAAMLGLAGCASTLAQPEHGSSLMAAALPDAPPSPRSECADAHVTLYFSEQVASDEPVVTPLLNDFMNSIRTCEAAGGELRQISIVATADPGQSAAQARAQVQRRQERVRAALVNAGAPNDKIVIGAQTAAEGAIMARRADIAADLY